MSINVPKRRLWSEDQMKKALDDINNHKLSVLRASVQYNVPRRTLRDALKKQDLVKDQQAPASSSTSYSQPNLGRKPILNVDLEKELISRLFRLSDVGYPLTPRALRKSVFIFCQEKNIESPFNQSSGMAGRKWFRLFMARHPEVAKRKAQHLNEARARKLNRFVVGDYFKKLELVLDKMDLKNKPQNVYNMDEKGVRMCLDKSPMVLAQKGVRRVHSRGKEHGENVTVVGCGNGIGNPVPPMVIFKGIRKDESWVDTMPTGSVVEMSPKGSMTSVIFCKWLEHFSKFKSAGPCLLILDGAKCHINLLSFKAAEKHNIQLFLLPSNTTHELQPMDKAVFRSFEQYWDEELLNYWSAYPDRDMNKSRFGRVLTPTWERSVRPQNIKSGFEACGIVPFNPNRIPDAAFAPSDVTHRENNDAAATSEGNSSTREKSKAPATLNSPKNSRVHATLHSPKNSSAPATLNSSENSGVPMLNVTENSSTSASLNSSKRSSVSELLPEKSSTPIPSQSNTPKKSKLSKKSGSNALGTSNSPVTPEKEVTNEANTSVFRLLCTPKLRQSKKRNCKKSVNTTAIHLTRDVFSGDDLSDDTDASNSDIDFDVAEVKTKKKMKKTLKIPTQKLTFKAKLREAQALKKSGVVGGPKSRKRPNQEAMNAESEISKNKKKRNPASSTDRPGPSGNQTVSRDPNWYCFLCQDNLQIDMRACVTCGTYVHEECVGLTNLDLDMFVCPRCD